LAPAFYGVLLARKRPAPETGATGRALTRVLRAGACT
jgi:hypothetical protein